MKSGNALASKDFIENQKSQTDSKSISQINSNILNQVESRYKIHQSVIKFGNRNGGKISARNLMTCSEQDNHLFPQNHFKPQIKFENNQLEFEHCAGLFQEKRQGGKNFSKTQVFLPHAQAIDKNNKTMHTLQRVTRKMKAQLGKHPIGQSYMKYRRDSLTSREKTSKGSSSKNQFDSSGKLEKNLAVMEINLPEFRRPSSVHARKSSNGRDFFMLNKQGKDRSSKKYNHKVFQDLGKSEEFDMVKILDKRRRDLLVQITGENRGNQNLPRLKQQLKLYLKYKKQAVLKMVRTNRALGNEWKTLTDHLQQKQYRDVQTVEYLKRLMFRDKMKLNQQEINMVEDIRKASESQIKVELSKIIDHETTFIKVEDSRDSQLKKDPFRMASQVDIYTPLDTEPAKSSTMNDTGNLNLKSFKFNEMSEIYLSYMKEKKKKEIMDKYKSKNDVDIKEFFPASKGGLPKQDPKFDINNLHKSE